MIIQDTICAISSPPGDGATALIRISGSEAFKISEKIFRPVSKEKVEQIKGFSVVYGYIMDNDTVVDDVLLSVFKNPRSYTGEDTAEISCHGSSYLQNKIIELLIEKGARLARPGEFTLRAFLNGKMDLTQAEGIADLISSQSDVEHQIALNQMRGGFSKELKGLREKLLTFISLIELELDFGEEDVEFADRSELKVLLEEIRLHLTPLIESFRYGNVLKEGIPVAIIGEPNVGKSTLLNTLLKEEKAIVTNIPGTTRDAIEDTIIIDRIKFRFIDTAGIREADDEVEVIGIKKTYEKIKQASIVLYMIDASLDIKKIKQSIAGISKTIESFKEEPKKLIVVVNKTDKSAISDQEFKKIMHLEDVVYISAKYGNNIDKLTELITHASGMKQTGNDIIITNARHYEALLKTKESIERTISALNSGLSGDLISLDARQAIHYIGTITGEITNDEVLGTIFSRFCIGK